MSCKKCKCKVCSCIVNEQVKISVNKVVQNPNEKGIVDIKVPTKTSDLINDSGFGQGGNGGGKIEEIRVNGVPAPVQGKVAIITVPTKTSDLTNDLNFVTKPYVDSHIVNKNNPHNVTKEQLNLGNVDNTSDLNKPISTATQNALDSKISTTDVKSEIVYEDLKPVNSVAIEKYAVKKINTISDLRNTAGEYEGQIVELLGYYEAGDKEPLNYKWTNTQGVDDGGSVINTESGSWEAQWGIDEWKSSLHYGLHGTQISDHTERLQSLLDLGGKIFLYPQDYNIASNQGLEITKSNTEIGGIKGISRILQNGVTWGLSINRGDKGTSNPNNNIKSVKIHDIVITNTDNTFNEHHHAMNFHAFTDLEVYNCDLIGFRGDGIYIGSSNVGGATERHNFNFKCHHNTIDGVNKANRNAISIIDCKGADIYSNIIKNTTASNMPGAIDIEPNANTFHVCQDIKIHDNELYNIGGNAGIFCIYGGASNYDNQINNIEIFNNNITGTTRVAYGFNIVTCKNLEGLKDNNINIYNNNFGNNTISRPYYIMRTDGIYLSDNTYEGFANTSLIGYTDVANSIVKNFYSTNELFINSTEASQCYRLFSFENLNIINSVIINSVSTHIVLMGDNGIGNNLEISGVKYFKKSATATWFINKLDSFQLTGEVKIGNNNVGNLNTETKIITSKINSTKISTIATESISQGDDLLIKSSSASDVYSHRKRVKLTQGHNSTGVVDYQLIYVGTDEQKPSTPYRGQLYNSTTNNTLEIWSGERWHIIPQKVSLVNSVSKPNATDLTTALELVNEQKTIINDMLSKLKIAGIMNIQ